MRFWNNKMTIYLSGALLISSLFSSLFANQNSQGMNLTEALEIALKQNPGIRSVRAQRDAAEAKVRKSKSDYFPQVTLSSGYTRYEEPTVIIPIHEIGVFPPLDNDLFYAVSQVKLPLFNGGRTAAAARAAKALANESVALKDLTEMQLIEHIAQIYIQSQELLDKEALIIARLNVLQQSYHELNILLQEGRVSPADLALVTSSLELTRADKQEIESISNQLAIRLGQLLGTNSPIQPLIFKKNDIDKDNILQDTPEITSEIAGPHVRKSQARLDQAEALHSQASRSFWPEINGTANYFLHSGGNLDLFGEWAVGVNINLPIFDGGRRMANVKAAKASMKAAEEALKSVQQAQNASLKIALEQWHLSNLRQAHLADAAESKQLSVKSQKRLYEAGRISLVELLTQETELMKLQIDERSAAYVGLLAVLFYHASAGSLTSNLAESIVRSML
jgi:outer membrane protein TolC